MEQRLTVNALILFAFLTDVILSMMSEIITFTL